MFCGVRVGVVDIVGIVVDIVGCCLGAGRGALWQEVGV